MGKSKKNTKTEFLVHWKEKSTADVVSEKAKDLWSLMNESKTISRLSGASSSRGRGGLLDP